MDLPESQPASEAPRVHPREKLKHVPLRGILLFFGTLLVASFMRSPILFTLWLVGWAGFLLVKIGLAVKLRVEQEQARKPI